MSRFSYRRGVEKERTKRDKRVRNVTIAIDETGNLGKKGKMFTMVATVTSDVKDFESIAKIFADGKNEKKAHDADHGTKHEVLVRVNENAPDIYVKSYKKSKLKLEDADDRKEHYFEHTECLLREVFSSCKDIVVDLMFDETSLVNNRHEEFKDMCIRVAGEHSKTIDWLEMRPSATENILQVNDYVASIVGAHYEKENEPGHESHELFDIIRNRVER